MSKIKNAFSNGKAFIGFLTAGDPCLESSVEFILEMERAGADLIEIGIPFSDPVAEGIVIQEASLRALSAGMTTDGVFEIATRVREKSQIPLCFMTYLNPVFHYGYEKFFSKCGELKIDGIIIPDLPFEEKEEVSSVASRYDVDVISLIAPTSHERIRTIAKDATGFIYVVSSMGVTGMRSDITTDLGSMLAAIKEAAPDTPAAIGFGINTPAQAKQYSEIADGVIVGSAIVKIIEEHGSDAASYVYDYVKSMKDALR
ncbi:MAG: tryptophan synthase subunit alpha [Lachnospiraceae bacterium]|nr:tryptophan synthase subunit alpha [Lachnospiraceae bacterium]